MAHPVLRPITRAWMQIIKKAYEHKAKEFGNDADQARKFFDGPYDWLYTGSGGKTTTAFQVGTEANFPRPTFRMTHNKAAEVVQLYGPSLYSRNPHRQVTLRRQSDYPLDLIPDQQAQQALAQEMQQKQRVRQVSAGLVEELLNYTPNELDLRLHCRRAVDEALIIGMGLLWTEPYVPAGSPYTFVGSFYDTTDNLLIDPDMELIQDAKWIARRRVRPKWEVSRDFGIPMSELRGSVESSTQQATLQSGGPEYEYFRQQGDTNDLMVYFEIYSRMGLGHRMHERLNKHIELSSDLLDEFGDAVMLVVSDDFPTPLNLPEPVFEKGNMEEIADRLAWPTPYYLDPTDPWPFSYLAFHERPRKVWPMSHLKPGLGELMFLNWSFSFLADKIKNTSRDFIACLRSLDEDMKAMILSGGDLSLLEFEKAQGSKIGDLIQFLQHPPFNKDIVVVTQMMMQIFEERVGLNELMYGQSKRQLRSAAEANVKSEAMRIRPDDMAEVVEAWSTKAARKEAIASYWHLKGKDVQPILGPERAELYSQTVMQMDVREVIHEFQIRIEAGSIRKPNRDRDRQNLNEAVRVWGPVVQAYGQLTGDFEPLNFLAQQWEKVNEMEPRGIQFRPPPPPEPDQAAIQEAQLELEMKAAESQQKLQQRAEEHQMKMQQQIESSALKMQLDAIKQAQDLEQDQEEHGQEMRQDEEGHDQELTQDQQKHLQEMLQARQQGQLELLLKRRMAASDNGSGEGE